MRFSVLSWRSPATVSVDQLAAALGAAGISKQVVGMGARTAFRRALVSAAKRLGHPRYDIKGLGKGVCGWTYQLSEASEAGGRLEYSPLCVASVIGTSVHFDAGDAQVQQAVLEEFNAELENQTSAFVDSIVYALFKEHGMRVVPFCRAVIVESNEEVIQKLSALFNKLHAPFRVLSLEESQQNNQGVAACVEEHVREKLEQLRQLFEDDDASMRAKLDRASDLIGYLKCFGEVLRDRADEIGEEIRNLLDSFLDMKGKE